MQHASPYVTGYMKVMEKENTKKYLVILDNEDNGKVVVSVAPALTEYQKRRIEGTTQVGYAKNFLDYLYMFCNGMKDISQATLEQIYEFGTYLKEQGKSPDTPPIKYQKQIKSWGGFLRGPALENLIFPPRTRFGKRPLQTKGDLYNQYPLQAKKRWTL